MRKIHVIKCESPFYRDIDLEVKKFEIRHNDRDYKHGDILLICHWEPESKQASGAYIWRQITYITDYNQKDHNVVLGITTIEEHEDFTMMIAEALMNMENLV